MGKFPLISSIVIMLVIFIQPVFSQQKTVVKGYIFNTETSEPVINATIVVSDTKKGTSSGNKGYFELHLNQGTYRFKVTSVGFSGAEFSVKVQSENSEPIKIGLQPIRLEIEGVDVFANLRIAEKDTSINKVPLAILPAVTRISAIEIEKQGATTLTDALKFVPGGWTENRGRKTKQFFSVRGQKYPYPDYSIDGIWQKEFEETGYFLSALDIESVEIVRSSSALVKGLSGLTGVIEVKTKKPERESISALAKYGGLNTYSTSLQYGNKMKDISFNTSASFFGTDGPANRNGKERIGNFHGNMDWKINSKLSLTAGTTYIYGLRQLVNIVEPGSPGIASRVEEYDPVRTLLSFIKVNYLGKDGSSTEIQTNVSYRNADFYSYSIPLKTTTANDEKDWEYGFNLLHSRLLSKTNTIRFGALYNHWVAPEGKRYYTGHSCNVHTWSGVVTDEQQIGKFRLDAGLRIISGYIVEWGGFGIEGSGTGFEKVEPITNESAPFEWQSALGVSYPLSNSSSLHYNFSGGTIAPRKGSLNNDGEIPETETRLQHDLGFRYKSQSHHEITLSAFYTQRNNAISYNGLTITLGDGQIMELYENLDKRSYGMELASKWNIPLLRSSLFANAMLMKGEVDKKGTMVDDAQLPKVILNTGFYFDYSGFDTNFFVNYTGPYTNNRFVNPKWVKENGDFPLGDFVSADLTVGYTFRGKFSKRVFVEVKNILDQEYMTVAGYPDQGRLFMAGVKINY